MMICACDDCTGINIKMSRGMGLFYRTVIHVGSIYVVVSLHLQLHFQGSENAHALKLNSEIGRSQTDILSINKTLTRLP